MKRTIIFLVLMMLLFSAVPVNAAGCLKLTANEPERLVPLFDYSAFVKIRLEKYTETLNSLFKAVKKNYGEKLDEYHELIDIINHECPQFDRA
ncbi:MAG TPA: hypothetical protein PKK26_19945 [Candidatus Wallbacteria bacterium]|nr:hypothetical protein [Candidatus Wallbacteria bacterium]